MAISCYQISCLTNKGDLGRRRKQPGKDFPHPTPISVLGRCRRGWWCMGAGGEGFLAIGTRRS